MNKHANNAHTSVKKKWWKCASLNEFLVECISYWILNDICCDDQFLLMFNNVCGEEKQEHVFILKEYSQNIKMSLSLPSYIFIFYNIYRLVMDCIHFINKTLQSII